MNQNNDKLKPHDYDGIQEYDNQLPKWWIGTFVLTVVFGFGYWLYFHVYSIGPGQVKEMANDLAVITQQSKSGPEVIKMDNQAVAVLQKDSAKMGSAKASFAANCAACHGAQGQGIIGPNLTDEYWIHGGSPDKIQATIANGVVEKGMLAWKGIIADEQIDGLVAYILSLQGSNPPNPKEPQGEK